MGFLSGSTTFERFRITTDPTGDFGEEHIEILTEHRIGANKSNLHEAPSIGFSGGAHLLDTQFSLEKNILGEAMHFGVRIDSCSVPTPIKNAWMKIELAGIMTDNLGGRPSKAQRDEAKDAVDARCEAEAKKGNYLKMSEVSVLWDSPTGTLFVGSTSEKTNESILGLIEKAFGLELSKITSGKLAIELADDADKTTALFGASPTGFLPDEAAPLVTWWNGMSDNYDYLGNEFLLWLWWKWDVGSDTIPLSDSSEITGMFARSLSLDCPQGEHGKESISSESPVKLPEANMAIRMGKLPRKAGLTLIRNGEQYDLTLQAEMFSISSARISHPGEGAANSRDTLDRIESIRQLAETIDLLFEVFCDKRIGKSWSAESKKITQWLQRETAFRRQVKAA